MGAPQKGQVVSAAFCRLRVPTTYHCLQLPLTLVRLYEAGLQSRLCCSRPHVHACPTGPDHTTAAVCARKGLPKQNPPACSRATGLAYSLPNTLNQLLVPYFTMGRAVLTDRPFAFVDLGGRALTKTSMSSNVHSMLSRMDLSFPRN